MRRGPPQVRLERSDPQLLNETGSPQPTQLDALLLYPGTCVAVESKLHEAFGACKQPTEGHCSGTYGPGSDLKTRTQAPCRLQIPDGQRVPRLYWNALRSVAKPDSFPVGESCLFAGPTYQPMRVTVAAARFSEMQNLAKWRVLFGFPHGRTDGTFEAIEALRVRLRPEFARNFLLLDYRALATRLLRNEDATAAGLGDYMTRRLPPKDQV